MAYQALYRTLRPRRFSEVVGQKAVVETLRNQILQQRIGHAYLLCGTRGTGKTTIAKIFARAVNCLHPDHGDPCLSCEVCRALDAETNMDVVEIDAASNNGVDEIRDLRDKIKYPPAHGKYRVYIIDEVHMLSTGAFNALLKTLEEPPAHAIFILATTEPQRIPATILSRCQRMDFHRLTVEEIADYLSYAAQQAGCEIEDEARFELARAAEGAMRDALSLLDTCISFSEEKITYQSVLEVLGTSGREFLFGFVDALAEGDEGECLRRIDQMMRGGRDAQVFVREVASHLRSVLTAFVIDDCAGVLEVSAQDAERFRRQAQKMGYDRALRALDLFVHCEGELRYLSSPRALLEITALRACDPSVEDSFLALRDRLAELEKKVEQLTAAAASGRLAVSAGMLEKEPARQSLTENETSSASEKKPAGRNEGAGKAPAAAEPDESGFWKEAMAVMKKQQIRLYGALRRGRFAGIRDNQVCVAFDRGNEAFVEMLTRPADQKNASAVFSQTAGKDMGLRVYVEEEKTEEAEQPQKVMEDLFAMFGRENVEIRKSPK